METGVLNIAQTQVSTPSVLTDRAKTDRSPHDKLIINFLWPCPQAFLTQLAHFFDSGDLQTKVSQELPLTLESIQQPYALQASGKAIGKKVLVW